MMKELMLIQWGKNRSVVEKFHLDTLESEYFILDNQYLMLLDEMGLIK